MDLAFSPDASLLALLKIDPGKLDEVVIWDEERGSLLKLSNTKKGGMKTGNTQLFFSDDGTKITVRDSLNKRSKSWRIRSKGKVEGPRPKRSATAASSFSVFSSTPDRPRYGLWSLSFHGNGQQKNVIIPVSEALRTGPMAHCRDRVAIAGEDGGFLVLDVSRVLEGIDLPHASYKMIPSSFGMSHND